MPKPTTFVSDDEINNLPITFYHSPLYLDPHMILDAENVRPGESAAEHESRVAILAEQIDADGQSMPIKVIEVGNTGRYQAVAGQGRLDALRLLNNRIKSSGGNNGNGDGNGDGLEPLVAWCVLDSSTDVWASAVKENVQRKNYTDVQLADLIMEARDRYKWHTKGGGKKLAAFFGITEQHLVEYNTLSSAPADVRAMLQSGEVSKSGALRLLRTSAAITDPAAAVTRRAKVAAKAKEIATTAIPERKTKGKEAKPPKPVPVHAPVKVQAKHIAQAAREVAEAAHETPPAIKRNRTEILAALQSLVDLSPDNKRSAAGLTFLLGLKAFADGEMSPRQLQNRWNAIIGISKK